jgi:SAM-dependent methyltransferase
MAIPLTGFLSAEGRYEGVDTWTEAVDWCSKNITPRFGNFHFSAISDIGPVQTSFPFEDGTFDFAIVCAISKLDKPTFEGYVGEVGRLLRPGGTYFGCYFVRNNPPGVEADPQGRLMFSEEQLRELLTSNDLVLDALYRGTWDGDPVGLSYQDILVAKKREA